MSFFSFREWKKPPKKSSKDLPKLDKLAVEKEELEITFSQQKYYNMQQPSKDNGIRVDKIFKNKFRIFRQSERQFSCSQFALSMDTFGV